MVDDFIVVLQDWTREKHHDVRLRESKGMVQGRGRGDASLHRNRRFSVAGAAYSDEPFWQPGGMIWRGKKGKMERGGRSLYRHGGSSVKAGIKWN
jgi:hypothetical protein